jgi:anti-anti-sigma factor
MSTADPPEFRAEEVTTGSAAMVSLYGELDIQHQDRVAASLSRALDRHPAALAADLRGQTFMDSTGVHALLDAQARCRSQGTPFFIIRGTAAVDRVLSVLGLDRVFEIISEPEQLSGRLSQVPGAV